MNSERKVRQSGIELYKILAMVIIVTIHTLQSIGQASADYTVYNSQVINLAHVTGNLKIFVLALFWNIGFSFVDAFFVSSAWFLRDSRTFKVKSPVKLVLDVWIISVVFLMIYLFTGAPLAPEMIIKSILPTLFSNNWFITCYLFMYLLYPLLNLLCDNMDRRVHLLVVIGGFIYCTITTVSEYLLFYSKLIVVVFIYLLVAYVKKYMQEKSDDIRLNRNLFIAAAALDLFMVSIINILGQRIGFLSDKLMHLHVPENPLLIIMAVTGFNLFRKMKLRSAAVNYISGLTLYIYVIHENILFRTYTRPAIWHYLITGYGYGYIIVFLLFYAAGLFLSALLISAIYNKTVQRLTDKLAERISGVLEKRFDRLFTDTGNT